MANALISDLTAGTAATTDLIETETSGGVSGKLTLAEVKTLFLTDNFSVTGYVAKITSPAGNKRQLLFQTAGVDRASIDVSPGAESGGSAGSNFVITVFNDAGAFVASAIVIMRATGYVGINKTPSYRLHIEGNDAQYVSFFHNTGNNSNRSGIGIASGTNNDSGTNTAIDFFDGDATLVGSITHSGGTVTYGAFTGNHPIKTKCTEPGILLKMTKEVNPDPERPNIAFYECEPTTIAKDKAVFGTYGGEYKYGETEANGMAYCLGDGAIFVTDEGGDIEIGDYLCSSNVEGCGMKQDDDILHNYTAAKATEAVKWSSVKAVDGVKKVLIGCTYHAA